MEKHPKVLVIIVTWNKKRYVLDLLNSLDTLSYPRDALDILVVDNASTDGTVDALRQRQDIHLLCNPENLGGTGGFNTGLAWAFAQPSDRYDYLWLLDNDVQVHKDALAALVTVLEENPRIAVAGSTMLQLDYPWRINEMGANVDRNRGSLILHRHMQEVPAWKSLSLENLRHRNPDLRQQLGDCPPWSRVDYVAAASLLVRSVCARQAGLWDDYFLHYDDVEWCLRIANMGRGIAVVADSLIWHLSAFAKVPTWVLYYDNRNVLYMLEKHGRRHSVLRTRHWIRLKAIYYMVLGKSDIARLHIEALRDYRRRIMGKRDIRLDEGYGPIDRLESTLQQYREIRRILIPWNIKLDGVDLPDLFNRLQTRRPDLEITILVPPYRHHSRWTNHFTAKACLPSNRLHRWFWYLRRPKPYDLVLQSDYTPHLAWSWLANRVLFVNNEHFSLRQAPRLAAILKILWDAIRS